MFVCQFSHMSQLYAEDHMVKMCHIHCILAFLYSKFDYGAGSCTPFHGAWHTGCYGNIGSYTVTLRVPVL